MARPRRSSLDAHEHRIYRWLAAGMTHIDIAKKLGVSNTSVSRWLRINAIERALARQATTGEQDNATRRQEAEAAAT